MHITNHVRIFFKSKLSVLHASVTKKERVRKSNYTCTLLCGPWCPCSADRSHPSLTLQHLQSSSMPAWSLWSSMIQRLTDSTTQRWHNTHLLFYTSTLMRFNKKRSSCILFTEYRHPRRYKRFLQQIHKREVWKFLGFLLLLCLSPLNSSATETQPYVRCSGRSLAQLSSLLQKSLTPLCVTQNLSFFKTSLPDLFFRTPFVSSRSIFSKIALSSPLRSQTAIS